MVFSASKFIGDYVLDNFKDEIPLRNNFEYRIEDFGYTIFDTKTLKTSITDKIGFSILKNIDGKRDLKSIIRRVSRETNLPYFLIALISQKQLSHLSQIKIIKLNKEIPYKFKDKFKDLPILRGPNQISWLITNCCNLKCSHCGNTSRTKLKNELTKEECFDLINQCANLNVFVLNISGGEPFLREDWFEILSYARKKGIEIGITTNGTLINEEITKKIKKLNPFNIHISLDGIGKVHDEFRNKEGVFKLAQNSIRLFKKYGIPFGITTSITKKNFHDLDNIKNFIKKNNINSWNLYYALPVGCLSKVDSISQEEFYKFAKKVSEFRKELKDIAHISVGDSLGYYGSLDIRDDQWMGCGAGICGCSIDAEGNVKGCPIQHDKYREGSIRKNSLKDIWLKKGAFSYNREPQKLSRHCNSCKYKTRCRGGCKSSMYAQGTNFNYNDYCVYHIENSSLKNT